MYVFCDCNRQFSSVVRNMKLVLTTVSLFALFNINTSGAFGVSECGKVILNKGKSNGEAGSPLKGQWPWEVALYRLIPEHRYICGGTLVSNRHIVTAAHCAARKQQLVDKDSFVVYLGQHNIKKFGEEIQVRAIKDIRFHPEHDVSNFNRDLAILELHQPVTFTDWVQPACLWPDSDIELRNIVGQSGTLVGWPNDDEIDELLQLETPVVSQETCIRSNSAFYGQFTSDSTYCAGSGDVCIAGGHGMVFEKDGSWYLRGVVSLALAKKMDHRCDPTQYTIFADVAQALPWIKENVKDD